MKIYPLPKFDRDSGITRHIIDVCVKGCCFESMPGGEIIESCKFFLHMQNPNQNIFHDWCNKDEAENG